MQRRRSGVRVQPMPGRWDLYRRYTHCLTHVLTYDSPTTHTSDRHINGYECICPDHLDGNDCEVQKHCDVNSCSKNGDCTSVPAGEGFFSCDWSECYNFNRVILICDLATRDGMAKRVTEIQTSVIQTLVIMGHVRQRLALQATSACTLPLYMQ